MGALGDGPPFSVEEDERCEAVGIGGLEDLLDDLVGEAIEGWRRDGRLVDAGATGVGRRGVHDALGL